MLNNYFVALRFLGLLSIAMPLISLSFFTGRHQPNVHSFSPFLSFWHKQICRPYVSCFSGPLLIFSFSSLSI